MPTQLLESTLREGAESLQHLIERRTPAELTVEEVEEHVAVARIYTRVFRSRWAEIRARLDQGVEDKAIRNACVDLAGAIDNWLTAAAAIASWHAELADRADCVVRGFSELTAEATWAKEVVAVLADLVSVADAFRGTIDIKRIEEAQAAFAKGGYKNIQDILKTRQKTP